MSTIDLTKYGITDVKEIVHNPSYEVLFAEETKAELEGYEKGQNTELDTVNVMTGIYNEKSLARKLLYSLSLEVVPSLLRAWLIVILILLRSPPY